MITASRFIASLGYNKRQADTLKEGIRSGMQAMRSTPQEIYPRFSDYGVNSAYQQAAQNQLSVKPATSDPLLAHAIEQDAKNKASQLQLEGNLKTSELFSNYQNQTDDLRRQYAGIRNETANANRQSMANLAMATAQVDSGRLASEFQSIDNLGMQQQHELSNARDRYRQDMQQLFGYQSMNARNKMLQQELEKHRERYEDEGGDAEFGSIEAWLQKTQPEIYAQLQQSLNKVDENLFMNLMNLTNPYFKFGQSQARAFLGTSPITPREIPFDLDDRIQGIMSGSGSRPAASLKKGGKTQNKTQQYTASERI